MGLVAEWLNKYRRLLGAAVLLALASLMLWRIRGVLLPFLLAIVLSYLFNPLVKVLVKKGFSRTAALIFIYVMFVLILAVGVGLVIPTVVFELNRLAEFVPQYFAEVQEMAYEFQARYSEVQLPQAVRQAIDDAVLTVQGKLLGLVSSAAQSVLGIFSALFSVVLAPILSFYLLKDVDGMRVGLGRFIPAQERKGTLRLLSEIDQVVAGFVRGQLIVAAIVGTLVTLALLLLKIRFAMILGIVAGITEIIPYFGPFIGAIPALAVAASTSTADAVKVLIALVAVQQLEAQLISPRIIGKHVGLHPLAVIFALLAGFELFGVVGMIVAVPIAGIIRVLVDHWVADRSAKEERGADDVADEQANVLREAPIERLAGAVHEPAAAERSGGPGAPISETTTLPRAHAGHEREPRLE